MQYEIERWDQLLGLLKLMHDQLILLNGNLPGLTEAQPSLRDDIPPDSVYLPFKGSEIYLILKAFIDAGGAPHENYKSILEKTIPNVINKTHKRFSVQSLVKYSDKVDFETKDSIKRFLQKMIRNIDSYD